MTRRIERWIGLFLLRLFALTAHPRDCACGCEQQRRPT